MSKSPFVITFSGDPVAGKSSAINALMERYQDNDFFIGERDEGKCIIKLAAGQMFRSIANNAGIELQELNDFAKQPGNTMRKLREIAKSKDFFESLSDELADKSVDSFIDDYMLTHIEMLKTKYEGKDDVIIFVDSRIAGLLMKKLGRENMGIRLSVQPEIAAKRMIKDAKNRKGEISLADKSLDELEREALESVVARTSNERKRFIKTYSADLFNQDENAKVDIQNLDNYDLIINTSGISTEREIDVLYPCIEKARNGQEYDRFWRSTKYILPIAIANEKNLKKNQSARICAIKSDKQYYVLYGQDVVGQSNHLGYEAEQKYGDERGYFLVPVELIAKKDQFVFYNDENDHVQGFQADMLIKKLTLEEVKKFENKYGFKYPESVLARFEDRKQKTGPQR